MPFVSMASASNKIDGSLMKSVYAFLQKLQMDDTAPGLHIEPMQQPKDKRVRTGRVNDAWRAVLYKMVVDGHPHYVYYGTWHHDEAIKIARSHVLKFNSALGAAEFEDQGESDEPQAQQPQPPEPTEQQRAPEPEPQPAGEEPTDGGAAVVPPWDNHLRDEWTAAKLTEEAGIRAEAAERALAATTQAELNAIIDDLPETQGLVLLGLANGDSLEDVRSELGLEPADAEGDEDEQIEKAIRENKGGFVFVGDNPDELREAIESMEIDRWRVFLHPEQRKYVEGSWNGPYRLSGGAGTGKTVVLVHRARALAKKKPEARILLTTFTKTLADALRTQMSKLDADVPQVDMGQPGVTIWGLDKTASQVIRSASSQEQAAAWAAVLGHGATVGRPHGNTAAVWEEAVDFSSTSLPEDLLGSDFLEQEYVSVVLANGVTEEKDYLRASRKGRGTALNRHQRKELWKVMAQFRRTNQLNGVSTYPEIAAVAAAILRVRTERGEALPFDHVLVDEGQDFHAGHWLLIRALAVAGVDDLFIAEDSHQRIYGQKVPLSRFGIEIRGRARRLRLNYRTTAENLAYAISILEGAEYTDIEDEAEHHDYRSVRSGPAPKVLRAESPQEEIDAAVRQVKEWIGGGAHAEGIAVLVRTHSVIQSVTAALGEAEIRHDAPKPGQTAGTGRVSVMTMHAAKGMEFERVVVLGGNDGMEPPAYQLNRLPAKEQGDARLRERSLFYVAATRARDELVVMREHRSNHAS